MNRDVDTGTVTGTESHTGTRTVYYHILLELLMDAQILLHYYMFQTWFRCSHCLLISILLYVAHTPYCRR